MCHLRPGENIEEEVKDILKPEEVKALAASTHRPNYCMQVHCGAGDMAGFCWQQLRMHAQII